VGKEVASNPIGLEKFKKLIEALAYENVILSESGTLFIQFYPIKNDESKIERIRGWFWNKISNEMIPKYNLEFDLDLETEIYTTHVEIKNLYKLPEAKVKKFFGLFKWVYERL